MALVRFGLFLAALLCFGTPAFADDFTLVRGLESQQLNGPDRALGAVIWNHGRSATRPTKPDPVPFYLDRVAASGWDVYRMERSWDVDYDLEACARALEQKVKALRAAGYRKIVLAGQSWGAWISLMVGADMGDQIHAVVAMAPAAWGNRTNSPVWMSNATRLYPIMAAIRQPRVMMFLFEGDIFDPGNRGAISDQLLGANGVDHLVIDRPAGFIDHGAANWRGFATRFAPCIVRFLQPERRGVDADCGSNPVTRDAISVKLPLAPAPADQHGLRGAWYGIYPNGREAILAIEDVGQASLDAVYAWGSRDRDDRDSGYVRRTGTFQDGKIIFSERGLSRLIVRPVAEDQLALTWIAVDGSDRGETVLRRLN